MKMKNKKGFTLVELLAVIVILALLVAIAVPSTFSISNRLKTNMYCSKIDTIENAAQLWGEDYRDSFQEKYTYTGPSSTDSNVTETLENLPSQTISVKNLVEAGALKKDQKEEPYIVDPRDKKSDALYQMKFVVYVKYNRIYVAFPDEVKKTCDK